MATLSKRLKEAHRRRKMRIRKKIHGTVERPRLVIVRSLKHISASLVDDVEGRTLSGFSDLKLTDDNFAIPKEITEKQQMSSKVSKAFRVGLAIAEIAKDKGVSTVVFDRNGLRYHGRVKALAEGARKGGLEF